jgi:HD superfamily phosphodiesterase
MQFRERLILEMKKIFAETPYGVEHTLRVLENAERILAGENAVPEDVEIVVMAAILHDIGALEALSKYGSLDGPYQEQAGEFIARQILKETGVPAGPAERVCFLVGHHHTPAVIDGPDFQILWEADQLDNLEHGKKKDRPALEQAIAEVFKTATGLQIARSRLV